VAPQAASSPPSPAKRTKRCKRHKPASQSMAATQNDPDTAPPALPNASIEPSEPATDQAASDTLIAGNNETTVSSNTASGTSGDVAFSNEELQTLKSSPPAPQTPSKKTECPPQPVIKPVSPPQSRPPLSPATNETSSSAPRTNRENVSRRSDTGRKSDSSNAKQQTSPPALQILSRISESQPARVPPVLATISPEPSP
jgi:hypothetical protein